MRRKIAKGGTRGSIFKAVARERLLDAEILLKNARFAGAVYLAGYAVECILKWAATERSQTVYLPAELEIHDLDLLLEKAGLRKALQLDAKLEGIFSTMAARWLPEFRYISKDPGEKEARNLYEAAQELYRWVRELVL